MMGALAMACAPVASDPVTPTPGAVAVSPSIEWNEWSDEAFARAKTDDKMVLVDVGIEGCTACRWMYEDTYEDPDVVARVREYFVAISVDADVEPDLGERYARWGWPATIVIAPDGTQVLAIRGNKRPRNFIPILDRLITLHAGGRLPAEAESAARTPTAPPPSSRAEETCLAVNAKMTAMRDRAHGGWGGEHKEVRGLAVAHEMMRGHARADEASLEHVLRTARAYARVQDRQWGGTFVGSKAADFSAPIPEKRTAWTATALRTFAYAYAMTGDARWYQEAKLVDRWLTDFMRAPDGRFYATQEDRAPGWPSQSAVEAYFELSDAERRRHGIPPVDHGIYTDINGAVIEAYVGLYEATGDQTHLETASTAATAVLAEARRDDGGFRQAARDQALDGDARMRGFRPEPTQLFLRPQAVFGRALLSLYRVTGDRAWLSAATEAADTMLTRLTDRTGGGLRASDRPGADAAGSLPLADNAIAAQFLLRLSHYTKDDRHAMAAQRALLAIAASSVAEGRGEVSLSEVALAWEWWALGPVEISVVGDPNDAAARALFAAAVRVHEPRKVLHYELEGRYPRRDHPTLFVCTREACSSPVAEPAKVAETVAAFTRAPDDAPCGG
jgi:uncharacterized protein YyaL (SSP411 family)